MIFTFILFVFMILVVGRTRLGKTTGVVNDLRADHRKKLWLDPQDSLAPMAAKQNPSGIYERLREFTCIQHLGLFEGDGTGLEKMRQDKERREEIKSLDYGPRNLATALHPLIDMWEDVFLNAVQYQRSYYPLYWRLFALDPQCQAFELLKDGCQNEQTKWEIGSLEFMSRYQWRSEVGPLERLLKPIWIDSTVIARCGQTDLTQIIHHNQNIYVEGAGASENAIYVNILSWMYGAIRYVEQYRQPLLVVGDEVGNFGLPGRGFFTDRVLRAVASLEKYGLEFCFITQTIHSLEPEIQSYLLDNARRIVCYGVGSPETARIMAEVMGTPRLNPNEINHTTSRWVQLHDGYDEERLSVYNQFEDVQEHRRSLGDQQKLTQQSLMCQGVGERWINEGGRVWHEKLPMLEDRYPWGISDQHFEQFKQSMEFNPWFTKASYAVPQVFPRGKKRDEAIQAWVNTHPSIVEIIGTMFFQGRKHKAYRRTQKLRESGQLPWIGTIRLGDGRPTDYYSGWKVKEDNYHHELELTRFCACYPGAHYQRGYDVDKPLSEEEKEFFCGGADEPEGSFRSDTKMWLGGELYYVEFHTGSMRGDKARERFDIYRDTDTPVLWVCEKSVDGLLEKASSGNHWFAELESIQADPNGYVWVNNQGTKARLEP